MDVPKVIHQTWKSRLLPKDFESWSKTWEIHNPEYEFRFYNDKDCYKFMYDFYPQFLDLYEDLTPVQKADVFRYLVLHKYGGVYADMDTVCFRSLDTLINSVRSTTLITGIEYEGNERGINNVQYLQWFIASSPGHPVLLELVKEIENRNQYKWFYSWFYSTDGITYWLTGPEVFTEVLRKFSNLIKVMPKGILGSYDPSRLTNESYLQHKFSGSWKLNWDSSKMR